MDNKIFIDGGAHLGESIKYFLKSKILEKELYTIYSFEAHPKNFKKLKEKYGNSNNIYLFNEAIWISDEYKDFYEKKKF